MKTNSLTPRQKAELELDRATKDVPIKHINTEKELEDFFIDN